MWIFNLDGFFSVVEKPDDNTMLQIRSRYRQDILRIANKFGAEVMETPNRDYPYRIYVSKQQWVSYLRESAENIDYTNFKDASLEKASIERQNKYHSVWSIMAEYGENRKIYCEDCGKQVSDEDVEISIKDGRCQCAECMKKERISAMEKTFDYPLHREPDKWKSR